MQRLSLIALLALVALAKANGRGNDLIVGHRQLGDELIEQKEVHVGGFLLRIQEKDVTIAGDGSRVITMVEAIDLKKKAESAKPTIKSGGPGYTYVNLNFESVRSHGIHFLVNVYGKRIR